MNIQRKNSAHHFRMQSEREQTLELFWVAALKQLSQQLYFDLIEQYDLSLKNPGSPHEMVKVKWVVTSLPHILIQFFSGTYS